MAIAFTYDEATNKVVLTGGTSGTPATFADFVTADRAGTGTKLLDAGSPASDLALTYVVRPVEDLAIVVKCVVANKTAEADFIFITGKDWRGAAQTESIDVTAGDGSYTSTKYWSEITTLDCSDNAAGGGTVWADGDLTVTQDIWGVIWDWGNGHYQVDCAFDIGNGSTSTYFASKNELVTFPDYSPKTTASATLTMGELSNTYSKNGSYWRLKAQAWTRLFSSSGTIYIYASMIEIIPGSSSEFILDAGNFYIYDSVLQGIATSQFKIGNLIDAYFRNVYFVGFQKLSANTTIDLFEDVWLEGFYQGFACDSGTVIYTKPKCTNETHQKSLTSTGDITLLDSPTPPDNSTDVGIFGAAGIIREKYTCNIHIADKDGANLSGATVLCEDKDGNEIFSVNTDANGDIAEQVIEYKKWEGTSETETAYSPHKFTISLPGYETLVLDAVTVDAPIVWHLELQPIRARIYGRSHRMDIKQYM